MNFLWYLFIVCALYQIVYQLVLVFAISRYKSNSKKNTNIVSKSVSVIICARNETENLHKNLPYILSQKYDDFEVILVDDGSDIPFQMQHERLKIIRLSKEEKIGLGKKYALQKGIEKASKELILLTDADCQPVSENWITEMATLINNQHKIVLGISPYIYDATFLNSLIEYETAQTAMQYIGFAILGKPYMCVGRNVCYEANLLKTKSWTDDELAIASGDDDLAIQTLATTKNTTVCLTSNSYILSEAKKTWSDWFLQKKRHAESGFLYKFSHKILLGSYIFTKIGFCLTFFCVLCMINQRNMLSLVVVIVAITITSIANMQLHKTLNIQKRWTYTFILDPIYGAMQLLIGLQNLLQPNQKWK